MDGRENTRCFHHNNCISNGRSLCCAHHNASPSIITIPPFESPQAPLQTLENDFSSHRKSILNAMFSAVACPLLCLSLYRGRELSHILIHQIIKLTSRLCRTLIHGQQAVPSVDGCNVFDQLVMPYDLAPLYRDKINSNRGPEDCQF